jgi:2-polyprenyl-6-methoxyphenol hydroxylase-like FAD-dependent oxidoreductase
VRRQLLPQVRVVDTGGRTVMGATPLRAVAGTGLPDLIGDDPAGVQVRGTTMVLAAHRFTVPPVTARDRWLPDLRSPAVARAEDYLMWALPVPQEALDPGAPHAAVWRRARELAADLHPSLRSVVDEAWRDVTVALRGGVVPPVPAWSPGPVTLIGDAIHAAPGFGGNLAMQDAHRLRDALLLAARREADLLTAIGGAEDAMRRAVAPALAGSRA